MKKLSGTILAAALFALVFCGASYASEAPALSAAAFILTDADSGRTLAECNADERHLIASTTKIMTAMLVLERCDPDMTVTIEPAWTGIEGSTMYLEAGRVMTVRELLYGLMLASGNDAAEALACIAAGSTESFVRLMNERAAKLGCENTHFDNPSGLDGTEHYSTARDLAVITREALRSDGFRDIVSLPSATAGGRTYTNHNRLLGECEGVFGVKTGYTEAAGRTLVSSCERGGMTLICVTLSDPDDWRDHAAMYDWAFAEYTREAVLSDCVWSIPVVGGQEDAAEIICGAPLYILRGRDEQVTVKTELPAFAYADVIEGSEAGRVTVLVGGEEAASAPLVYARSVYRADKSEPSQWERLLRFLGFHGKGD